MTIDDNVKQKLLNLLAEEPTMVLSTAYVYAKNYVMYGEDITKAWNTAVQQASIIQEVRHKAWAEAYDSFKADYEARLKADMMAMLEDLKQDFIAEAYGIEMDCTDYVVNVADIDKVIQQEINKLRGGE